MKIISERTIHGKTLRLVQGDITEREVDAIVNGTQNMTINGKQVPFRNLGENVLDKPVDPFTGTKTVHGLLGYSGTGQITVSQNVPLAMTVLGLEYRLSVGN